LPAIDYFFGITLKCNKSTNTIKIEQKRNTGMSLQIIQGVEPIEG
jgi:hypothetical protein